MLYPEDFLERRTTARYSEDGGRAAYDAVEAILTEHARPAPRDLAARRERFFAARAHEDEIIGRSPAAESTETAGSAE